MLQNHPVSIRRIYAEGNLVKRIYRKRGASAAIRSAISIASVYGRQLLLATLVRPAETFTLNGESFRYLRHWHVTTFLNERTVELPIVVQELRRFQPARLLEIGNVLNYYLAFPHIVVDKYEVGPGVLNVDVVDFQSVEPFDMIVSVSTLEHVGWDEKPQDPDKAIHAVQHLRGLLAAGGRLICTIPLGYNPYLDAHLAAGRMPFDEVRYLRRVNARNEWTEATAGDMAGAKYGTPYMHANALAVGFASRPAGER